MKLSLSQLIMLQLTQMLNAPKMWHKSEATVADTECRVPLGTCMWSLPSSAFHTSLYENGSIRL